jgi:hypothetical protein
VSSSAAEAGAGELYVWVAACLCIDGRCTQDVVCSVLCCCIVSSRRRCK